MEINLENLFTDINGVCKSRPFIDADGKSKISVYKGTGDYKDSKNYKTLQTNATAIFTPEEWTEIDKTLREVAAARATNIKLLKDKGLVYNLSNPFAAEEYKYLKIADGHDADVSMNFKTERDKDKQAVKPGTVPIPIISWLWDFDIRDLQMSRTYGRNLDLQGGKVGARKIAEKLEKMLFGAEKTVFDDKILYSIPTFPDKNVGSISDWSNTSTTTATIIANVLNLKKLSIIAKHYGPWILFISNDFESRMDDDFLPGASTYSNLTVKERILKIGGIMDVIVSDFLPSKTAALVQMSTDTIELVNGLELTTVQWENKGNIMFTMLSFVVQSVVLKSDFNGNSGIVVGTV